MNLKFFQRPLPAYTLPFLAFMVFLAITESLAGAGRGSSIFLLSEPKYWVFPLQTLICGGLLLLSWKAYDFAPGRGWFTGFAAGLAALVIWISPQAFFGVEPRVEGFNPDVFPPGSAEYWFTVIARMTRLVIVVPLLEEIFWRGFLMRYLIKEDFTRVTFGTYSPLSFFGVAVAFMLVHSPADYPAALLTGLIYNGVAVRTRSLFACVLAHAVTNLALGIYILNTKQWGFW